jgi:DNA-binding transcriptional MerR regulator
MELKNLADMAAKLNIHRNTLRSWVKKELIIYHKIGTKLFFDYDEIISSSAKNIKTEIVKK